MWILFQASLSAMTAPTAAWCRNQGQYSSCQCCPLDLVIHKGTIQQPHLGTEMPELQLSNGFRATGQRFIPTSALSGCAVSPTKGLLGIHALQDLHMSSWGLRHALKLPPTPNKHTDMQHMRDSFASWWRAMESHSNAHCWRRHSLCSPTPCSAPCGVPDSTSERKKFCFLRDKARCFFLRACPQHCCITHQITASPRDKPSRARSSHPRPSSLE